MSYARGVSYGIGNLSRRGMRRALRNYMPWHGRARSTGVYTPAQGKLSEVSKVSRNALDTFGTKKACKCNGLVESV